LPVDLERTYSHRVLQLTVVVKHAL